MNDFIITVTDCRRTGKCVSGMRHFARAHHLSLVDFIRNGISAQRLLDTGDHVAIDIVNKVKESRDGHGG